MDILKKMAEVLSDDDYNALVDYIDSQYAAGYREGYDNADYEWSNNDGRV
jgi:hypothetical protein